MTTPAHQHASTRVGHRPLPGVLSGPSREYRRNLAVHRRFEAQADKHPDSVAVEDGDMQLSYGQLNRHADQLAYHLRTLGVGPDQLVGVLLPRSPDLVIAFLAVLKAGGAYVPLDADYPAARLQHILTDTRAKWVVTSRELADRLPATGVSRLIIEDLKQPTEPMLGDDLNVEITPESLAYVIYTSGSTGQPKGVAVQHSAVSWLVDNVEYLNLDDKECVALASSPAFDAITFEIWAGLSHGARLAVVPRATLLAPHLLGTELSRRGVTILYVTAALLYELSLLVPDFARGTHALIFGGQAADPAAVDRVLHASAPARLIQVYGPTETTVWSSWQVVEDLDDDPRSIPLGAPIANTQMYILNPDLTPSAAGESGEVYLGGDCVTRGYLGRPALTAERFLPNPFAPGRLYRTGDRARSNAAGSVEFLGRTDRQVKVRGFRVELDEVEYALRTHPGIRAAVVTVDPRPHQEQLIAYIIPDRPPLSPADVRSYLGEVLPGFMVPSSFIELSALPRGPHGKLDQGSLPIPGAQDR